MTTSELNNAREALDRYTRTKPMCRAAHELADTLRAVIELTYDDVTSDRRAWQLGWDVRTAVVDGLQS